MTKLEIKVIEKIKAKKYMDWNTNELFQPYKDLTDKQIIEELTFQDVVDIVKKGWDINDTIDKYLEGKTKIIYSPIN